MYPHSLHAEDSRTLIDLPVAMASGFLGTLAMTTIMYVVPAIGIGQVDLPIWVARLFVSSAVHAAAFGLGLHVIVGCLYALLYALQIEPRLAMKPAYGGVMLGAGLWAFAQFVAVPVLGRMATAGGDLDGPGFLALNLGGSAALASLVAHLAYGLTVALVYGCHDGPACAQH